jgi:hypothetical protein
MKIVVMLRAMDQDSSPGVYSEPSTRSPLCSTQMPLSTLGAGLNRNGPRCSRTVLEMGWAPCSRCVNASKRGAAGLCGEHPQPQPLQGTLEYRNGRGLKAQVTFNFPNERRLDSVPRFRPRGFLSYSISSPAAPAPMSGLFGLNGSATIELWSQLHFSCHASRSRVLSIHFPNRSGRGFQ